MTWLNDTKLRDLEANSIIEATCLHCGHTWRQTPLQLLLKVDHRDVKMSEVAKELACRRFKCKQVGARLNVLRNRDTSSFVGGLP